MVLQNIKLYESRSDKKDLLEQKSRKMRLRSLPNTNEFSQNDYSCKNYMDSVRFLKMNPEGLLKFLRSCDFVLYESVCGKSCEIVRLELV